ncbi:MAG: S-methyl-5'-thioadenosine phosphorylase [Sedimentisphaerales bacterium]|nr:S-methyl-5'-thioadenosine phosphorylase [Sedimentisphaerales bacterium]
MAQLIGIITGTGLGDALAEQMVDSQLQEVETPFGKTSADILVGKFGQRNIALLNRHGQGHELSPSEIPFAANIFALKELGVRAVITTGAVGSLREEIKPGELVIVDQFIDKTFRRQVSFFGDFGAVHCEMSEPACPRLRNILIETAQTINLKIHSKGTYVCMEGPQFSTHAESLMHRAWGGDLVGMTAMPEAKLAREAQICYVLIALASDYDCWRPHDEGQNSKTLLQEIVANLQKATDNSLELIKAVLRSNSELIYEQCTCRKSLDLAVWTDKSRIAPDEKKKLETLFE